ncbi:MAG TPA: DUF1616 domain-containing protein [Roseiflexaceae bacterium]|nr:DUF1616 domain-containing protein [Roseiflexaceae bacterium]
MVWRQSSDLLIVILAAGAALLVALMPVDNLALRTLVALPIVLLVPGYATQAAIFPSRVMSTVERGLFSVGLSLAVTVLGGVLLNLSPWGLQQISWAVLLGAVTLLMCSIALLRRLWYGGGGVSIPEAPSLGHTLLFGLAGAIVIGAIAIARTPVSSQGLQGYTSLWLLPSANGDARSVLLGISSEEFTTRQYRLELHMNQRLLHELSSIELATGEQWEQQVDLPADLPDGVIEAVLYRLDAPEVVYRRATLWRTAK